MTLLILFFTLAVLISFLCSLLESVLLSVTPAYIALAEQDQKRHAKILAKFKNNIDQPLAAILTLNTIANTVGATGVGAQALYVYGDGAVAGASAILTLTILIFSEIIPKTLGASKWKLLAPVAAHMINVMIYMMYPFVILSRQFYSFFSTSDSLQVTRQEMIANAEIGANEGSIRQRESRVIKNLLMLDKVKVSDIMTPRSVVSAYDMNLTVGELLKGNQTIRFSRIPVFKDNMDHVEGLLHRYKLMEAASHDLDDLPLHKLMTTIHTVPEDISAAAVLDQFIKRKEHLFLVVDEYGTPEGIVTLEDAIETLLGVEIVDELDSVEDMRQYARDRWRSRKNLS